MGTQFQLTPEERAKIMLSYEQRALITTVEEIVSARLADAPQPEPPVPTPEDPVRLAFEAWLSAALDDKTERYSGGEYASEDIRWAWAAWQAARADAGKPEPVEELLREAAATVHASLAETDISDARREYRRGLEQRLLRAGKAKGGQ